MSEWVITTRFDFAQGFYQATKTHKKFTNFIQHTEIENLALLAGFDRLLEQRLLSKVETRCDSSLAHCVII